MEPYVLRYWILRSRAEPLATPLHYRALPTAHSDLVFNLANASFHCVDDGARQANVQDVFFVGMADWCSVYSIIGEVDLLGVQFRHEVLREFLRCDMHELTGLHVDLSVFLGSALVPLTEQLRMVRDDNERIRLIEMALLPMCANLDVENAALSEAVHVLLTQPEAITVRSLGARLGLSVRQLERIFKFHTGLSPKRFSEVGRFMKATHMLNSGCTLTDTAFALGYADQSHFSRAIKRYSNLTPRQFIGASDVAFFQDAPTYPD